MRSAVAGWAPRSRRLVLSFALGVLAVLAVREFGIIAARQAPTTFPDSYVYLQTAAQPARLDHFFFPKPVVVPAVYRLLSAEPPAIEKFQQCFAIASWLLLGLVLGACLRRPWARSLGVVLVIAFALAPYRIGWTSAVLSESINDSLLACVAAVAIALSTAAVRIPASRRRTTGLWLLSLLLAVVASLWILTRDTNAITAIVACPIALVLARVRRHPWALALAAAMVLVAGFAITSTTIAPTPPTGLTLDATWKPNMLARGTFSLVNNVFERVAGDRDGRTALVERGFPQLAEIDAYWKLSRRTPAALTDPRFDAARDWVVEHGAALYVSWLVTHPLARSRELLAHVWNVMSPADLAGYVPRRWSHRYGPMGIVLHRVTTNVVVLVVLMLAAPWLLRRPRAHPLTGVALVLVLSGMVGAAAAYYGDTLEISRHCYGSGQQIVLGLFLAVVAWLDQRATTVAPAFTTTET